jgi:glycosyltransferase involved in cell wall biosynthesis
MQVDVNRTTNRPVEDNIKWPRITVVTCSYNQGKFLEEAMRSVLDQGYPNLEYIVMDGGSKDNSVEIIKKYEHRLAYWASEPDKGQSDAIAKGFERATGDILAWLCSDDLLENGCLFEVGEWFAASPENKVVFGDTIFIDDKGAVTRRYRTMPFNRWILLNTANYIPQPSTFWSRLLYEEVGGMDRALQMGLDPDLWIRLSEKTRLVHKTRYWSRMRFYPEIKSLTMKPQMLAEHRKLELRYLGHKSHLVRSASRTVARVMRIAFKLFTGCYWA